MGTSIYTIVQVRKNGEWVFVPKVPDAFSDRNYSVFAVIGGERDSFGDNVFEPKGLPDDIGQMKYGFHSYASSAKERYETEKTQMCILPDGSMLLPYSTKLERKISEKEYNDLHSLMENEQDEYYARYAHLVKKSSSGEALEYAVHDAQVLGGTMKQVPLNEIFPTFEDFLSDYYEDDWDEDAQDYGEWDIDFENGEYCSCSYLTLKELEEADYHEYTANKYKMSRRFYDAFIASGGVFPDKFSFKESSVADIRDAFQEASMPTITVCWQMTDKEKSELSLFKGIQELRNIAQEYFVENHEDIRIVFGFD